MYPVDSWVDLLELLFNLLEYIERIIHKDSLSTFIFIKSQSIFAMMTWTGTGYPEHISWCS